MRLSLFTYSQFYFSPAPRTLRDKVRLQIFYPCIPPFIHVVLCRRLIYLLGITSPKNNKTRSTDVHDMSEDEQFAQNSKRFCTVMMHVWYTYDLC